MNKAKTLLVEGKSDQEFFSFLLKNNAHLNSVEISPPKMLGSSNDGITGILERLPNLLKFQDFGGHLGIVLDADYQNNDEGFEERRNDISEILNESGYFSSYSSTACQWQGELFHSDDGLNPIGLWIMPDHQSEGMLETLLLETIIDEARRQLLGRLNQEINTVNTLEQFQEIRFKNAHKNKILLNTWLNWQKQPTACKSDSISIIDCALQEGWLDLQHQNITSLIQWLETTFVNTNN